MAGHFEVAGWALPREGEAAGGGTRIGHNRRASQRFKAKPGSMVSYVEGAGAIRDLSMDGVFLLDSEPLPIDTKISFSAMLGNETVSLQGIVRRSVPREGMGIQFADVPLELRRRLLSNFAGLV
jgi:PilZ domain-containing protein